MAFQEDHSEPGAGDGTKTRRKRTGRSDAGQEEVTKPKEMIKKLPLLLRLKKAADTAAEELAEAVKKVAEDTGYNASNVRALVNAKAGDNYGKVYRNVEQQHELFEEVGAEK